MRTRIAILMIAATMASGCNLFKKSGPKTPVVGERIAVLTGELDIVVDPETAARPLALPEAAANAEWNQPGGNASKSMGHLALGTSLGQAFSVAIGEGTSKTARLGSAPVVAGGRVYTIDTRSTVRAFDAQTGAAVWSTQFGTERGNEASLYGGGVAVEGGRVFATNGLGFVAALDATNGGIVWTVRPGGPLRGAPSVADGTLLCHQPGQSDLFAEDGRRHDQLVERGQPGDRRRVRLGRAGNRAGTVVAGFSSGELNAYRYENGRLVWQDALSRTTMSTGVASLSDIDADPVIDGGQVFAVGQGGRMVALELNTGQRLWETQHRRNLDAVGSGRVGLCRDRQCQVDRAVARQRQDPLDQPTAVLPEGKIEEGARSAMSARSLPAAA